MTETLDQPITALAADDPTAAARKWLADFDAALRARSIDAAVSLFATESFWRDLVSFTWNIRTAEGRDGIRNLLQGTLDTTDPIDWAFSEEPTEAGGVVEGWLTFETAVGRAKGHLRLKEEEDGQLRAWTLLTSLRELKGHEENQGTNRPQGVEHQLARGRMSWLEKKQAEEATLGRTEQPYVVVIGGGQGGIALGARLRQLKVPHVVLDNHDRPGDQWRGRYKSLCLHDPVWYDHLPYLPFPPNWPVFAPKDKIGDWLEMYTRVMDVPYWPRSRVTSATFDEDTKTWSVTVERDGEQIVLQPKQLVFATGMSGKPNLPSFPGMDVFEGEQQHSSQHPGPEAYTGKKVVVIGSNNSAHDICGALWEHDADVTMVQRSSTHIVKSATLMDIGLGDLYSERAVANGVTTDKADMIFASLPYRIMHEFQIPLYQQMAERQRLLRPTGKGWLPTRLG